MGIKIFEALNNIQGKDGKLGYTLTSTASVMNSLNAAKEQFEASGGYGDSFYTFSDSDTGDLISNSLNGYYDSDGFVNNGYLAQVNLFNYGAFVVSQETEDGEKYGLVPVVIGNSEMKNGIDCSGQKVFLGNVNSELNTGSNEKEKNVSEATKNAMARLNSNFTYGLAIDVKNFAVPFFQKYYPNLKLTRENINKLMKEKCISSTIKFNNTELTALVTVDYLQGAGAERNVFIPNVLLLQESSKADVFVKTVNENDQVVGTTVGGGLVKHVWDLFTYDNNTGHVSFGMDDVKSVYSSHNSLSVTYNGCSLSSGGKETKGAMRLFFNYDKKSQVEKILNVEQRQFLAEYEDRLFNLVDDEIQYGKSIVSGDGAGKYVILDVGHVPDAGAADWYQITYRRCRNANKPYPYDYKGQNEYDYNKKMANAVADKLRTAGCMVRVMDYTGISNGADINRVRKESSKDSYSAFVSFHCQSYGSSRNDVTLNDTSIGGSFAMIHKNSAVRHPRSKELAETIARRMSATWGKGNNTANDSRGLGVLRGNNVPRCLLEFSYINHKRDVDMLRDDTFHDKLATEIANGILEFCNRQA